jgi:hypothetical protein
LDKGLLPVEENAKNHNLTAEALRRRGKALRLQVSAAPRLCGEKYIHGKCKIS